MRIACFALIPVLLSCEAAVEPPACKPSARTTFGGGRPVDVVVPSLYDPCAPSGLLVLLHGYGAAGELQSQYLGFPRIADEASVLLLAPDGTKDLDGNQFWNATDACCDFYGSEVDDVAYVTGVIAEVSAEYNVDPSRVFLAGHSNGAFMSYRLACERADLFAGIVGLAGASFADPADCAPTSPVSILHLHGTDDADVLYEGESIAGKTYPGAVRSVTDFAGRDGCTGTLAAVDGALDLDGAVAGDETTLAKFSGCPAGVDVELATMTGSGHIPGMGPGFRVLVRDFVLGHAKAGTPEK